MAYFYHIYISAKADVTPKEIQGKMDLALDWFRYDSKNWIVYTTSDANKWQARLKPFVAPEGNLFICKLDLADRQGWMNKEFWKWLRKNRSGEV